MSTMTMRREVAIAWACLALLLTIPATAGRVLSQAPSLPPSPYADPKYCLTNGISVDVNGFPSSPFLPNVFTLPFSNPKKADDVVKKLPPVCDGFGNCMVAYELDSEEVALNLGAGCNAPTKLMAYNGFVPGPTFTCTVGTQVLVRHNNKIPATSTAFPPADPCIGGGRKGRPLSPHKHGSPNIASWDGFASNEICSDETKDYVYPCDGAAPRWYHDHALDITSNNVYYGLAGNFFVREADEPWGLQGIETKEFILQDKVFDYKCQFLYDQGGAHQNNLYGDINFVSGVPFPVANVDAKWIRISLLNGAVSRPWLISIKDITNVNQPVDVSQKICYVVSGDGGFRKTPIPFPANGLFMGAGERYEIVCNFGDASVKGKDLVMWNTFDDSRMKDVPFFCYSHLIAKIKVSSSPCDGTVDPTCKVVFQPIQPIRKTILDTIIQPDVYAQALKMAEKQNCTRWFDFGRSNGQWVINGQTWHTVRVAVEDFGVNSWEVWCFNGHGGWFHPVHMHLMDFYVLKRFEAGSYQVLEDYEKDVPKDMIELHPGAQVAVLVRWGPHRGEFMFHCHNIVHEDFAMLRTIKGNSTDKAITKALGVPPTYPVALTPVDTPFVKLTSLEFDLNTNTGVLYDKYNDPLLSTELAVPTTTAKPLAERLDYYINALQPYRLFYPGKDDRTILCKAATNPWVVKECTP